MAGRCRQAIALHGPIPLPLYEFGDENIPEEESEGDLSVSPFEPRPLHLSFLGGGLLDEQDVIDLIAYCKTWLKAVRLYKAKAAEATKVIRTWGEEMMDESILP